MADGKRRRNPLLAVLNRPGRGKLIGRGVQEVAYTRHHRRGRGGASGWVHEYRSPDVDVRGLPDGRVALESRSGKPLWSGGRERWLDNPPKRRPVSTKPFVGRRVKGGKVQDVQVTFDSKGKSTIRPIGPWRPLTASERDALLARLRNKGGTVARRAKSTKRRRSGGKRKPPRGFKSWKAYMASIRRPTTATTQRESPMKRKRRKSRGGRRRSNPAANRHSSRGKRRGSRRSGRRRNPPALRGILALMLDGAKGGLLVTAGKMTARAVPALIGVQPLGLLGLATQTGAGAIGAVLLDRFVSRDVSRPFLYGVFANAWESLIRLWNIPVLTPALGDETELLAPAGVAGYVAGYVQPTGVAGTMPTDTMGVAA